MKSTLNLRGLIVLTGLAICLTGASYAQDQPKTDESDSAARLEQFMLTAENNARFIAPDVEDINSTDPESQKTAEVNEILLVANSQQRNHYMTSNCKFNPGLMQVGYYQKVKATVWSHLMSLVKRHHGGYRIISASYIVDNACGCSNL